MRLTISLLCSALAIMPGCGTLTGIPGHGGGKRFSEEQRLVSSAIRMSVKEIDVSSLKGKDVAIIFGLIADEGAGNIVGGRASITAILTQGQVTVPSSSTTSSVDIFQVANGSNTTSTGQSSGISTTDSATVTSGDTNSSSTSSSTTDTNSSSNSSTSTDSNSTTNGTSSSDATGTSDATTTSEFSTDANQQTSTDTTSGTTGVNTSTNTGSSQSTSDGTGTSAVTSTGSGASSTNSQGTETGTSSGANSATNTQNSQTNGTSEQAIVTGSTTSASGRQSQSSVGITYEGLGQFQNLSVPKSDAAYLMTQVRNHFLLNGVAVRSPADPAAEVFVYVSVDILGTNRQRTDLLVYNQESLRAEVLLEVFAIDRAGKVVMQPQTGNFETYYKEDYIAWSGPFNSKRGAEAGIGLITDVGEINEPFNVE